MDEKPGAVIEIPTARVKLLVGAGGETIKWLQKKSKVRIQIVKPDDVLNRAFGTGAALTLDEFALILHLEDVYWTGEGRQSIDAIILGGTFMTLLLTGLLPTSILEVGDFITLSRWTAFALILSAAAFVIVCYLKGKPYMGTIGIFVLPVAVIGAVRLARPGSPWAHFQYRTVPAKLERACRREEDLAHWQARKYAVWDLIGGKPHLHLPHREGRKRTGGAGRGDGSPDPKV